MDGLIFIGLAIAFITTVVAVEVTNRLRRPRVHQERLAYIRDEALPPGLRVKVAAELPQLTEAQLDRVFDGLREWFAVCLESRYRRAGVAGMPSRAVDIAWHEFILFTREYAAYCDRALGGYLHHAPESSMATPMAQALARTLEIARPLSPAAAIPLLFTLDHDLGIEGGNHFDAASLAELEQGATARHWVVVSTSGGGGCSGGAGCAGGDGGSSDGGCGGGCGGD